MIYTPWEAPIGGEGTVYVGFIAAPEEIVEKINILKEEGKYDELEKYLKKILQEKVDEILINVTKIDWWTDEDETTLYIEVEELGDANDFYYYSVEDFKDDILIMVPTIEDMKETVDEIINKIERMYRVTAPENKVIYSGNLSVTTHVLYEYSL